MLPRFVMRTERYNPLGEMSAIVFLSSDLGLNQWTTS